MIEAIKIGIERHLGIILEALQDYRRWFADGVDEDSELFNESDNEIIRQIDKAIEYINGV